MPVESDKNYLAGWEYYERRLADMIQSYNDADILELGGGQHPSFELHNLPKNVKTYTVNDISQNELDHLPPGYAAACFDVEGDVSAFEGRYDVVFSRFMAEHVRDGVTLHRNVWRLLRAGGVAIHLLPTLYASPFVLNKLLPEFLTSKIFYMFKSISFRAKFAAFYSLCHGNTPRMRQTFEKIGYSSTEIRDFFGHFYYDRIPVLRGVDNFMSAVASRRGWSWYSSYAVIVAKK